MTQFPATDIARKALAAATVGTMLRIAFASKSPGAPDEVRVVEVTGKSGAHVYTSSGKVRPGHQTGGAVLDYGDALYFQPTPQQAVRRIRTVALA